MAAVTLSFCDNAQVGINLIKIKYLGSNYVTAIDHEFNYLLREFCIGVLIDILYYSMVQLLVEVLWQAELQ